MNNIMANIMLNILLIIILLMVCYYKYNIVKEHMASVDEAVANVASLYNNKSQTLDNLKVVANLNVEGVTKLKDTIVNNTLKSDGRLHISGPELLYLLNKNGVIVSKAWQGNGDLTVEGNSTVWGHVNTNAIKLGEWTISQDGAGRLQFNKGGKNLLSLAANEHEPSVFRSSGLMYTNKRDMGITNNPDNQLWTKTRPQMFEVIKNDPERGQNIMLLGGTQGHSSNHVWSVAAHRTEGGRNSVMQPVLHGHAPICPRDCGQNDWNASYL